MGGAGDRVLATLRGCERLAGVPDAELRTAAAAATLRTLTAGQEVFRRGGADRSMFVVERGRIVARLRSPEGGVVDVGHARAGDLFGYFEVFDAHPRDSDAVAEVASSLVVVPHPWGHRLLTSTTAALVDVVGDLLHIVRQQNRAAGERSFDTVPVRVARHLLALPDADGRVLLEGSQTVLAQRLGTTRQTLNKALRALADDGCVGLEPGGRALRVLDRSRLEAAAGRPRGDRARG